MEINIVYSFFLIFSGAAVLASVALFTRQPLILAYIVLGALVGPYGLSLINNSGLLADISEIGIIFLLFLLGLDMQPKALLHVLRKATLVALLSSLVFAAIGYAIAIVFGFTSYEAMIVAIAATFSSTIIGIKLLPTTVLHHRHVGEMVVGLLLVQDLIAIVALLILAAGDEGISVMNLGKTFLALPILIGVTFLAVKYVLLKLFSKFDRFHEYVFLLAIGWCLGIAELAKAMGLSLEIGAFIAGVTIATSPIAQYIAESLKPLRDFFLVLFFFSLGASLNLGLLPDIAIPAILLSLILLAAKPATFYGLLRTMKEDKKTSWEIGFRLGQISEFSLLIAFLATSKSMIGESASVLIQATAIIMFMLSSYIVVLNFPSPIAISDKLRRD
ncbi:cation:proton antiporter [Hahella sp. KA22]|uniref:cation:proton antiporter domain-containing protein n=1 Tax=unclassified Hahella TaxID=2624107 RepID=UPI000FDD2681|nr:MULTISPECIES: cation:proton antiporter [unclassified Hahella]AZZ91796.1 cation:proton antiporter [Hahella sp. KA22]MDG9667208.1 cation:proton antiporter [Hahella sp. CR1]QAY55166.1 cation:proton antiporter [Hahella sp. KA22]